MSGEVIVVGAAALVLFWSIGAYNRLIRLRAQALQAFGALAVQLGRRQALSDSAAAADAPSGLQAASQQFAASLVAAKTRPLDAQALRSLGAAHAVLRTAWDRHFSEAAVAGAGDPHMAEWSAIAVQLAHANAEFDQAVATYNAAVRQFPAHIVAAVFGLRLAGRLEP